MRLVAGRFVTLTCSLLLIAVLFHVSNSAGAQAQQEPEKPKAKRVWTNEDLENIKGGINVVGEPDQPLPSSKANASPAADHEPTGELCESDGWAHAVATVVEVQGARLDSKFWAARLFNNLCSSGIHVGAVSSHIAGDYTLEDGTKVRLKAGVILHNLPKAAEIVAAVNERRPFIIGWKGRPYVINRVDYVDNVYDGISMYTISKLYLTNAMTGKPTLFEATSANVKDIDGTLQVTVTTRQ